MLKNVLKTTMAVAVLMAVMWAAEAEVVTEPGQPTVGDWDGDGYDDVFQRFLVKDGETGQVDPPGGTPDHPLSGIYYRDGWCQCWTELPVIYGAGFETGAMLLDTPIGEPRLVTTLDEGGVLHEVIFKQNERGHMVQDSGVYEPPTASFQAVQVSPNAPPSEYSYGGACSVCSEEPGPNHGYAWKVHVIPASQIEAMQISKVCVRARESGGGGAGGAGGEQLFCQPVDWHSPGVDNSVEQFDYDYGGVLHWSPMSWDGSPLVNAWCSLHLGDSLEWQADVHHRGGVTTTTGWAPIRIYGCPE